MFNQMYMSFPAERITVYFMAHDMLSKSRSRIAAMKKKNLLLCTSANNQVPFIYIKCNVLKPLDTERKHIFSFLLIRKKTIPAPHK